MTDTVNLGLPCIEGSQAQKHVTHNEALRILDTLVQLAVLDRDLTAPPGSPAEGQRWIVNAVATGAWAGRDHAIAAWQDGVWQFSVPQIGWLAYVADEGALLAWTGSAWADAITAITSLNNMTLLGVGTTADATNPFSAKLNNTLFAAKTVADGGDGDLRYKLSKESAVKTLSFLFQDNFSGRAEIGLTGDDDFHFKVSPDGATWHDGIVIDRTTGAVSLPNTGGLGGRELLAANRTYYVRTDGSNGNTGLANSSGGAFATIQKAIDVVATLDLSIYAVTIQLGNAGAYTGASVDAPFIGGPGSSVSVVGDVGSPSSYVISSSILVQNGAVLRVRGVDVTSSAQGLHANNGGKIKVDGAVVFGACTAQQMIAVGGGSDITVSSNYIVDGGATMHVAAQYGAIVTVTGLTVTLTGTPNFSFQFANASALGGIKISGNTFSGSATGVRYVAQQNALVNTGGGGATYLPGDVAGSTTTGGQYV